MDMGPVALWESMGLIAKAVVVLLALLSIWSLAIRLARLSVLSKARRQYLPFAKLVTEHLKQDRPQAAIDAAKKFPGSHLAKVVSAGLLAFQHESDTSPLDDPEVVEAANRAVERSTLLTTAEFR